MSAGTSRKVLRVNRHKHAQAAMRANTSVARFYKTRAKSQGARRLEDAQMSWNDINPTQQHDTSLRNSCASRKLPVLVGSCKHATGRPIKLVLQEQWS
eukprot:4844129-Amphidinium_carterae.1